MTDPFSLPNIPIDLQNFDILSFFAGDGLSQFASTIGGGAEATVLGQIPAPVAQKPPTKRPSTPSSSSPSDSSSSSSSSSEFGSEGSDSDSDSSDSSTDSLKKKRPPKTPQTQKTKPEPKKSSRAPPAPPKSKVKPGSQLGPKKTSPDKSSTQTKKQPKPATAQPPPQKPQPRVESKTKEPVAPPAKRARIGEETKPKPAARPSTSVPAREPQRKRPSPPLTERSPPKSTPSDRSSPAKGPAPTSAAQTSTSPLDRPTEAEQKAPGTPETTRPPSPPLVPKRARSEQQTAPTARPPPELLMGARPIPVFGDEQSIPLPARRTQPNPTPAPGVIVPPDLSELRSQTPRELLISWCARNRFPQPVFELVLDLDSSKVACVSLPHMPTLPKLVSSRPSETVEAAESQAALQAINLLSQTYAHVSSSQPPQHQCQQQQAPRFRGLLGDLPPPPPPPPRAMTHRSHSAFPLRNSAMLPQRPAVAPALSVENVDLWEPMSHQSSFSRSEQLRRQHDAPEDQEEEEAPSGPPLDISEYGSFSTDSFDFSSL